MNLDQGPVHKWLFGASSSPVGRRWAPTRRGDVATWMPPSGLQRQVGLHGEDDQAARRREQGEDDEAEQFALAEVHFGLEAVAVLVEFLEGDFHLVLVVMELPQVVLDEFDAGLVAMHLGADAIGSGVAEGFLQACALVEVHGVT